jgi:hypothetical protein
MTTVLDPSLANSVIPSDSFSPVQFQMVGPFDTGHAPVLSGLTLAKFTALGMNRDGKLVALSPASTDPGIESNAIGSLNFAANPAVNDTVTIGGQAITFVSALTTGLQVVIGADTTATAQSLKALINATSATGVTASGLTNVLALEAITAGTAGNSVTLAKSATNPAISGATLTGGSAAVARAAPEATLIGFLAQPVDASAGDTMGPFFRTGTYNHEIPVWPAGYTTLAQRQALCVHSNLWVDVPK